MSKLVLFLTMLLLISCQKRAPKEAIGVNLDKNLIKIITEICNEGDYKQCENEIYIDRISPDSTRFTVRVGGYMVKYTSRPNPVMTTNINGIEFKVYTGAEQYIIYADTLKTAIIRKRHDGCSTEISTIIEKNGVYKLKKFGGEPFNYYPDHLIPDTLKFLPPDGKEGH